MKLPLVDMAIVIAYVGAVVLIGFMVKRRSAQNIEAYFLGSHQIPWWMLGMSGSGAYFDITGTMWIVSIFVMCGVRGMWVMFLCGLFGAAFFMTYMGKWIRRANVITGAEWMLKRFGDGRGGELARLSYTIYAILTISAFLGYTAVGMGKFGVEFLPISRGFLGMTPEQTCAAIIMAIAGIYVTFGGFRGLTIVEVLQTTILTIGALTIGYLGYAAYSSGHWSAPVPSDWLSVWPKWTLARAASAHSVYNVGSSTDYSMYYLFGPVILVFIVKGLLLMSSGPEQLCDFQKFLAAKSPREASLAGMLWGIFHTVRFPMAMGIAILGLVGIAGHSELVHVMAKDPEKVLPIVIAHSLPTGLRGLAVAALTSAFIGVFGALINGGASYLVRDVYQAYVKPSATKKELIYASYAASVMFIVVSIIICVHASSIGAVFTWIMGTLGAGILLPNVFRWYWARLNGWGYFAGTVFGMAGSLVQALLQEAKIIHSPIYVTFPILLLAAGLAAVVVSLLTEDTNPQTLKQFYMETQPAGAWRYVEKMVLREDPTFRKEVPFRRDFLNLCLALPLVMALYFGSVLVMTHQVVPGAICGAAVVILTVALRFTWWPSLPKDAPAAEQPVQQDQEVLV